MTGGRPEIEPALSAAWRHARAARAELRAFRAFGVSCATTGRWIRASVAR